MKSLICRLFGHRKVEVRVFVLDRALPLSGGFENVFIGTNLPNDVGIAWLKAMYGEYGHEEARLFCKRCGRWWKRV